jgi:hypothetical protein
MASKLTLPALPRSERYTKEGNLTLEWQLFYEALMVRVGGYESTSIDDIEKNIVGGVYETPVDYAKKIDDIMDMLQALSSQKSYDKRIDDVEAMLQALPSPKSYDKEISDLYDRIDMSLSSSSVTKTSIEISEDLEFFIQAVAG